MQSFLAAVALMLLPVFFLPLPPTFYGVAQAQQDTLYPPGVELSPPAHEGQALPAREMRPFPVLYKDKSIFLRALERAEGTVPRPGRVTGLTLPHHLLAAELMASGLAGLRGREYDRIILLSPDHFKRGKTPFTVPARDFRTCMGFVPLDREAAAALLNNPLVSESNLFSHEHGVRSLLPFIADTLPDTPVLPVSLGISSTREDWNSLADSLFPLLTEKTLVLQSTDFSHYLSWEKARSKDAESLRVIASGREELVLSLQQPAHLDSRAAQYLQMKLQRERFGSSVTVTANHNACEYMPEGQERPAKTTSYIVQVYSPDPQPLPATLPGYALGGDFFTGRYLQKHLDTPEKRERAAAMILEHTGGRPLILNFEGALMPLCSAGPETGKKPQGGEAASAGGAGDDSEDKAGIANPEASRPGHAEYHAPGVNGIAADSGIAAPPPVLCMPEASTLELLRQINCVAVSVANNHSRDLGEHGYERTRQVLAGQGIAVLEQGRAHAFPEFFLTAFTDVDNNSLPATRLLLRDSFASLSRVREAEDFRPLFAFVHCGREFRPAPGVRERYLVQLLENLGAELFIGAHPHRAGTMEAQLSGVRAWSLGNLLFDQLRNGADGAVLEVVFFPQGTWWGKQRHIGNIYKELLQR